VITWIGEERPLRDAYLGIGFAVVCILAPTALALSPRAGEPVAVIAMPWSDVNAATVIATAGGQLIDVAASGVVAIGLGQQTGFAGRLYAAGALLVLDGRAAAFCFGLYARPRHT
jgi:hypothetical protein